VHRENLQLKLSERFEQSLETLGYQLGIDHKMDRGENWLGLQ
jgi:hypothetical protein